MLRLRVLLVTAALGLLAVPPPSAVISAAPDASDFGAFPFGLGPTPPERITLETDPVVIEAPTTTAPTTTVTTAAPKPAPRPLPKKPVGDATNDKNKVDTRPKPKAAGLALGSPFVGNYTGTDIEGFARYEGQSTCDPTPKVGTLGLRDLLLARYPTTNSLGVSRACDVGGQSEHKEGRAFDWGADITNASDVAAVNDFLTALLATDDAGHKDALARRMGVMYVIWNGQIWGCLPIERGMAALRRRQSAHRSRPHFIVVGRGTR